MCVESDMQVQATVMHDVTVVVCLGIADLYGMQWLEKHHVTKL